MLLSNTVKQTWNSNNKKRYVELGYSFTNMKESFDVSVKDLSKGSNVVVDVQCDYCGAITHKQWYRYVSEKQNEIISKDCCFACKKKKIIDVSMKKYGVKSVFLLDNIQNKIKETNIKKYGSANVFASEVIKQKIYRSNTEIYGSKIAMQSDGIKAKAAETCIRRYGVRNILYLYHGKGENNARWRGGVAHHGQERSTSENVEWRKRIFVRDRYTCQCCGGHSGHGHSISLNAHHINNWKDFPEERYVDNNGITLCEKCHNAFHRIYGKRFNTKSQLDKYLKEYGKKIC